jgi:ferredoxin-NADP reductase
MNACSHGTKFFSQEIRPLGKRFEIFSAQVLTEKPIPVHKCSLMDAPTHSLRIRAEADRRSDGAFVRLLRHPWLSPLNDLDAIDDFLVAAGRTWSPTKIRARVVRAIRETADTRTLVLEPNGRWPGHRAGQHTTVEVEIDGRRRRRTFSLSSAPSADGRIAITVKRREGGCVSVWWNDRAKPGDLVTLSEPVGDFVLPDAMPPRIVMLAAGSGITPVMAMLRELDRRPAAARPRELRLLHVARSRPDAIFLAELDALADRHAWLSVELHLTAERGRPGSEQLVDLAREAGAADAYVCGPAEFMQSVRDAWTMTSNAGRLRFEHFGLPARIATDGAPQSVTAGGRTFEAKAGESLLEAAERAGLRPQYGCRMGVCHTCKCRKSAGVVGDLRDGRSSGDGEETIQLCISTAKSAVTLEL